MFHKVVFKSFSERAVCTQEISEHFIIADLTITAVVKEGEEEERRNEGGGGGEEEEMKKEVEEERRK